MSKKVYLTAINSKYIHSNLAVYSLRSFAEHVEGIQIEIGEFTINNEKDNILRQLFLANADIMCFSTYIWNLSYVESISREYKKLRPDSILIAGGPEVSYETERFLMENPQFDAVILGEGEKTFEELCACYVNQSDFTNSLPGIKGIAYEQNGQVIYTPCREPLDMDTLPFAYKDLSDFENRIIYYESSRGCPFSCSYCLSSINKGVRFRSLSLVKEELKFFMNRKVKQVKFVDRTFNIDKNRTVELLKFIKENDNGITNFHFEVSADILTDEEIDIIKGMRKGLIQLEIGVQSTHFETIREIKRVMNLEKLYDNVQKIKSFKNTHCHLDLIAGLPFEDIETFKKSFNDIYALKADNLQLGFLKVLKGSYMFEHASEYDVIYKSEPPYEVMSTKWLSYDDILKLKNIEEMLEVYYNSGQFAVSISLLETLFDNAFDMFDELGKYYECKCLFYVNHSRISRYEILLDYVRGLSFATKEFTERFKEALTFDLYSRENMKSRPSWAADYKKWSDISRTYCKDGKLSHVERFSYPIADLVTPDRMYYVLFDYSVKGDVKITVLED